MIFLLVIIIILLRVIILFIRFFLLQRYWLAFFHLHKNTNACIKYKFLLCIWTALTLQMIPILRPMATIFVVCIILFSDAIICGKFEIHDNKYIFSFTPAQHILSYHTIEAPWILLQRKIKKIDSNAYKRSIFLDL